MQRLPDLTGIWWHGTMLRDMRTILNEGLQPGKPTKYPERCHGFPKQWVGRESYGGVYLAASAGDAKSLAGGSELGPTALIGVRLDPTTPGVTIDEDEVTDLAPKAADSIVPGGGWKTRWQEALQPIHTSYWQPYPWGEAAAIVLKRKDIALQAAHEWLDELGGDYFGERFPHLDLAVVRPRFYSLYARYIQRRAVQALYCGWAAEQERYAREAKAYREKWGKEQANQPQTTPPTIFDNSWEQMVAAYNQWAEVAAPLAWWKPSQEPMRFRQPHIRTSFPITWRGRNRIVFAAAIPKNWHEALVYYMDPDYGAEAAAHLQKAWVDQTSKSFRLRWAGGRELLRTQEEPKGGWAKATARGRLVRRSRC